MCLSYIHVDISHKNQTLLQLSTNYDDLFKDDVSGIQTLRPVDIFKCMWHSLRAVLRFYMQNMTVDRVDSVQAIDKLRYS
jgi:hypothetical protein